MMINDPLIAAMVLASTLPGQRGPMRFGRAGHKRPKLRRGGKTYTPRKRGKSR